MNNALVTTTQGLKNTTNNNSMNRNTGQQGIPEIPTTIDHLSTIYNNSTGGNTGTQGIHYSDENLAGIEPEDFKAKHIRYRLNTLDSLCCCLIRRINIFNTQTVLNNDFASAVDNLSSIILDAGLVTYRVFCNFLGLSVERDTNHYKLKKYTGLKTGEPNGGDVQLKNILSISPTVDFKDILPKVYLILNPQINRVHAESLLAGLIELSNKSIAHLTSTNQEYIKQEYFYCLISLMGVVIDFTYEDELDNVINNYPFNNFTSNDKLLSESQNRKYLELLRSAVNKSKEYREK